LRGAGQSDAIQGNTDGTAHPNTKGHRATAERVAKTLRIDVPAPPPDAFTVRFLRLRVSNASKVKVAEATVTLAVESGFRNVCGHVEEPIVVTLDHTVDLTANRCARYDVRTVGRTVGMSAFTRLAIGPVINEPKKPLKGHEARHARPPLHRSVEFKLRQVAPPRTGMERHAVDRTDARRQARRRRGPWHTHRVRLRAHQGPCRSPFAVSLDSP
jgi:hypothetical protein